MFISTVSCDCMSVWREIVHGKFIFEVHAIMRNHRITLANRLFYSPADNNRLLVEKFSETE